MKNKVHMRIRTSHSFKEKVFQVVKNIPSGKTLSYLAVARRAGNPKACRAVGNILNKNYNPLIPCHRVVRSDGTAGGYNRGARIKLMKLKIEHNGFSDKTKPVRLFKK